MSKRTDVIRSLFTAAPEVKGDADGEARLSADNRPPEPGRRAAGAVNAIRSTFADIERENEALRASAATGGRLVEIDAALIDPSPFPDRFEAADDAAFAQLKASLTERGQDSPVLLRPHPTAPGRYQTAYGHRRIRALREIGSPVRALIRDLGDDDLAAAQGAENAARADLSFIERAMFALRLEQAGRSRTVIQQALAIDKAETSKLIAVAAGVPGDVVTAIGRAPRAGRPRWLALAEALRAASALDRVRELTAAPAFQALPSDGRFQSALATAQRAPADAAARAAYRTTVRSHAGDPIATVSDGPDASRILIDRTAHPGFADFVTRELPALFERFAGPSGDGPPRGGRG